MDLIGSHKKGLQAAGVCIYLKGVKIVRNSDGITPPHTNERTRTRGIYVTPQR